MRPYSPGGALNTFASAVSPCQPTAWCPSFRARTTGVSNPVRSPGFRASASGGVQQLAFATGVPSDLYAFHRSTGSSSCPYPARGIQYQRHFPGWAGRFHPRLACPPTRPLSPVNPNNVRTVRLTAAAGTNLARASSRGRSRPCGPFSPSTVLYNPKAFVAHAASLGQGCPHCRRSSTAATRRCLASVSVPVARVVLSHPLGVCGSVGRHPTDYLIPRGPLTGR